MAQRIEQYALLSDLHTAGIVGSNGSIDWLCLPHFDSASCFARLLGNDAHGYWQLAPAGGPAVVKATRRRYLDESLVLETEFDTATGTVRLTDCMPIRDVHPEVVRLVEGVSGEVACVWSWPPVRLRRVVPWVTSPTGRSRDRRSRRGGLWTWVDPG